MAYSGIYRANNPNKYKGNPMNIIYRSLWELKFMKFCDNNPSIVEWGSEEVIIPYRSPIDGRVHRYYVDFYIKVLTKDGEYRKYLIEIKPKNQTAPPPPPKRQTKLYKDKVLTFIKNQAKWQAANNFCETRQMKFLILTEDHLNV
jgi:hypothetical protein